MYIDIGIVSYVERAEASGTTLGAIRSHEG